MKWVRESERMDLGKVRYMAAGSSRKKFLDSFELGLEVALGRRDECKIARIKTSIAQIEIVSNMSPPSITPLNDLQLVRLKDLKLGPARGKVLVLRTLVKPKRFLATFFVAEDDVGAVEARKVAFGRPVGRMENRCQFAESDPCQGRTRPQGCQ